MPIPEKKHFMRNLDFKNCQMINMDMGCCLSYREEQEGNMWKEKSKVRKNMKFHKAAEHLYTHCGFHFVEAKDMFYEDTGWIEYKMFEMNL